MANRAVGQTDMTQIPAKNKPPFVIAIDIGSSSVRATLYDAEARRVEGTDVRAGHPLHSTPDGGAEEFADHLIENVERVLDDLLDRNGAASEHIIGVLLVEALAFANMRPKLPPIIRRKWFRF